MCLSNQYLLFLVRVFVRIKGYKQPSKKRPEVSKYNFFQYNSFQYKDAKSITKRLRYIAKNRNIKSILKDELLRIIDNNNNNNSNNNSINNNNNDNNNNNNNER